MKIKAALLFAALSLCGTAYADPSGSRIAAGTHFTIYGDAPADAYALLSRMDPNYHAFAGAGQSGDSVGDMLGKAVDGLYREVSDILDIHIYSFKGAIKVFSDQPALARFFRQEHGMEFKERSLYHFEKDVIYISLADVTVGMLGHEMAHAIISHYFVVPPPAKIQEVLCGYVEYSLRKSRGSLP